MVEFWKSLAEEITSRTDIVPANPTEVAEWFQITECPMVDCPYPTNSLPVDDVGPGEHAGLPTRSGCSSGTSRAWKPRPSRPAAIWSAASAT